VGLEGAHGAFFYDLYKTLPNRAVATSVANSFFQAGKISGPAHAGFTSYKANGTGGLNFRGVDDPQNYQANVAAYRNSQPLKAGVLAKIEALSKRNAERKARVFNADLKRFDDAVQSHQNGTMPLGAYVKVLSSYTEDLPLAVELFSHAYKMESTLDFTLVEQERKQVIEKLVLKGNEQQTKLLVDLTLAYHRGR
jgi:hypothetical protein